MNLTYTSCPIAGTSNRTYFTNKALISICYHFNIALPCPFFLQSPSHHPHFYFFTKENKALSDDKELLLSEHTFISFGRGYFAPEVETFNSGKETFQPRVGTFFSGTGRIFPRQESSPFRQESFLLRRDSFLLKQEILSLRENGLSFK
ncbi:MAG: hypothetical protein JZU53_04560 [Paludibacter sp.]|nr:hypothetical protein [Paludibacter sp.]